MRMTAGYLREIKLQDERWQAKHPGGELLAYRTNIRGVAGMALGKAEV